MLIKCKLAEILAARDITQSQFARDTGVSAGTIRKFCKNQFAQIDVLSASKFMVFLDLDSLDDLFYLDKNR